jgi:hypothetical protein
MLSATQTLVALIVGMPLVIGVCSAIAHALSKR